MPLKLDIVLPCYNPNDTWPHELIRFNTFIKDRYDVYYIVVNDGSTNPKLPAQIEFLKQNGISLNYISYEKNKGKGYALRKGVEASSGIFTVYTDIDFPFTDQSTSGVIRALAEGQDDIVTGHRDSLYYEKNMSAFRRWLSKMFRSFIRNILHMAVSDTQCGLKGFNTKGRAKFLSTKINRYLFDFEFLYLASKDPSLKIRPVQVQLKDNVVFSKMRFKIILQESLNLLSVLLFRRS